jgi:EAL domain-containing protein (putative c-di-GMP-specific phosphodiesterase class I)
MSRLAPRAVKASPETLETMMQLRDRGVRISLDDFGMGYASLSSLKDLPLDQLKVDRHFVRSMVTDSRDACIVASMLALGQSLRLAVIVEGVETEEERHLLEAMGCQYFQGYLFGTPGPVEKLFG